VLHAPNYFPFGTKCDMSERRNVCVKLCLMFNQLHGLGWSPEADSVFDPLKRRGTIVCRYEL
jgi:hypothetical protein